MGRQKRLLERLDILKSEAKRSLEWLVTTRDNENAPWAQRVECAMELVRQGYGKAPQRVESETRKDHRLTIHFDQLAAPAQAPTAQAQLASGDSPPQMLGVVFDGVDEQL